MAKVNLDKIRAKLDSLSKSGGSGKRVTWTAPEGKTVIRIVPNKKNPDFPFEEVKMHFDFGGTTYVSPLTWGDPDPIMEFAEDLQRKANMENDKEMWKQGKKLEPSNRYYVPILVRGQEEEGVKWWAVGINLYKEILEYYLDEDYGDLSDPKEGRDITVTREGKGRLDTKYTIKVKPSATVLTTDKEILESIKEQPDVMECFEGNKYIQIGTYDDLKQALESWLDTGSDEDDEEEETTEEKAPKKEEKQKMKKAKAKADEVEAQFDALFDD